MCVCVCVCVSVSVCVWAKGWLGCKKVGRDKREQRHADFGFWMDFFFPVRVGWAPS